MAVAMKLHRLVLACSMFVLACTDLVDEGNEDGELGATDDADEAEDPTLDGAEPEADTGLVPVVSEDESLLIEHNTGHNHVVYVSFGGPVINACPTSAYCNDAVNRRHHYIRDSWGKSSIDFTSWGTSAQRAIVIDFLRSRFSKYRVSFTTTKPTSGEYTMLVITSTAVGSTALRGKTDTDCYPTSDGKGLFNSNHRDIAFVVRVGGVSSSWVKRYAAHEVAHSFGLLHVVSSSDLMHYKSYGTSFTSGSSYDNAHNPAGWRCVAGSTQNEPALLTKALGLK
jgi:hypothetical protein